ncbi:MAG: hypothetical protein JWP94_631 [Mucilaginibacter sp.]|nr:hypothetical protein [Mucilaginibacter sp.]
MQKRRLLLLSWLLFGCFMSASGQKRWKDTFGKSIEFETISTDLGTVRTWCRVSDNAVDQIFLKPGRDHNDLKSPIMLGVKLNHTLSDFDGDKVTSISKNYTSYIISDSSAATLIALGIAPKNVKNYKYRVVENDSIELIPWSPIPKMEQKYGARKPYGFIGEFKAPGKQIMVEVVNIKHYNIRDGVIFDWRVNFKPVITQIDVWTKHNKRFNLNSSKLNRGYATKFDSRTGLPLDLKFPVDSINDLEFHVKQHQTVPFTVYIIRYMDNDHSQVPIGEVIGDSYELNSQQFDIPGKYELIIQRTGDLQRVDKSQQLRMPFEVLPSPFLQKKVSLKQVLPYAIATLSCLTLLFWAYRRNNKRKLGRSIQAKESINLKLRSIRSQLNPHFMFNALTSIQNLMNKDDTKAANHYLAMFADLTRKVLNTSEQELISLEDELKIVEDYLQMEQLRFGFQYQIKVDDSINIANTDIPAMLLQPFVENAVKHGIATLQQKGMIQVLINKQESDLVLSVTDNGQGFNKTAVQNNITSFGLKLSEERIALLNQVYKDQPVTLNIDSKPTGTIITINLTNLLS